MANQKVYQNGFKTVKKGEGKEVKYELLEITKDGDKEKVKKISENIKLVGAKNDAREYVLKHDPEATHFNIVHHKPGREKDAREVLGTKKPA